MPFGHDLISTVPPDPAIAQIGGVTSGHWNEDHVLTEGAPGKVLVRDNSPRGWSIGVVPIEGGGTGATNLVDLQLALGIATPPFRLDQGGTGGTSADTARAALGVPSASEAVLQSIAVARGDLIVASGPGSFVRMPPGADGETLVADSMMLSGVKWSAGVVGPVGPPGPMGPSGPTGIDGPMGQTGPVGPEGPQGIQGIQGIQGEIGPIGPIGPQGIQGVKGDTGLTGATGPIGPQGPAGPPSILPNNVYLRGYQTDGTTIDNLIGVTTNNDISVNAGSGGIILTGGGVVIAQNNAALWGRRVGGTDQALINVGSDDHIYIGYGQQTTKHVVLPYQSWLSVTRQDGGQQHIASVDATHTYLAFSSQKILQIGQEAKADIYIGSGTAFGINTMVQTTNLQVASGAGASLIRVGAVSSTGRLEIQSQQAELPVLTFHRSNQKIWTMGIIGDNRFSLGADSSTSPANPWRLIVETNGNLLTAGGYYPGGNIDVGGWGYFGRGVQLLYATGDGYCDVGNWSRPIRLTNNVYTSGTLSLGGSILVPDTTWGMQWAGGGVLGMYYYPGGWQVHVVYNSHARFNEGGGNTYFSGQIHVAGGIWNSPGGGWYNWPDYVFEHAYTGEINEFAQAPGAKDYEGLKPLAEVEAHTREHWTLPNHHRDTEVFRRNDDMLAELERIYLYLFDHEKRLAAMEAR